MVTNFSKEPRKVGGEGWRQKVHNGEEWKKLLQRQGIVTFCTCQWNEWM